MPIPPLVVEDGTGITGSNTYASADFFDSYCLAGLYSQAYTAASADQRQQALLMASRHIDAQVEFWGVPLNTAQGLAWPRQQGRVIPIGGWPFHYGPAYPEQSLLPDPRRIVNAACELALQLLSYNYTGDAPEKGVQSINIGQSAVAIVFNSKDRKRQLPEVVESLLQPFGTFRYCRNNVAIRRVQ